MIDNDRFNELWRSGRAAAEAGQPSEPQGDADERGVYEAGYHNDPGMLMSQPDSTSDTYTGAVPPEGSDHAQMVVTPFDPLMVPVPQAVSVDQMRVQLIELISATSEDRYAAGWDIAINRELLEEGGLWELLGRAVGWPVGVDAEGGWQTWDEARASLGLDKA